MKSVSVCLLLATAASSSLAAVLPEQPVLLGDDVSSHQAPLSSHQKQDQDQPEHSAFDGWMERLRPIKDEFTSVIDEVNEDLSAGFETVTNAFQDIQDEMHQKLQETADAAGHDFPDKTIYELIQLSEHATKFAKIVDDYPDVVKLLNGTKTNHTLFVPVDEAFEHLPEHDPPPKELVEAVLKYHIGLGDYPARRILHTNTVPTAFEESWLGDEPQRLRTSVGFNGVTVNFYSKVIAADIGAKNGIIHAVRHILVPPPMIGRILTLDPSRFSTLLLAYDKTDFVKFIHHIKMTGSTVFAPDNAAFASLGYRANAFLFNTEKGLKYLKALLKYHIATNVTLYSDAVYDKTGDEEDAETASEHYELKTLLDDAPIGVDIAQVLGFKIYRINGFAHAKIADVPGKNGVIQVTDKVLIPPHKHDKEGGSTSEEIEVDDLMERLASYVD